MRGQEPVALRHGPLSTILVVKLAHHARNFATRANQSKELFLDLILDNLALFLNDKDFI